MIFARISEKIIIKNQSYKKSMQMNINGTVEFISNYSNKENEALIWYVTKIDDEITLFSNGFYLFIDETKKIAKGDQFMKVWKFECINNNYIIYYENKDKILSLDNEAAIITGENNNRNKQLFQFIDEVW